MVGCGGRLALSHYSLSVGWEITTTSGQAEIALADYQRH